jgi:two-component system, chemotaxis family, response regulator Rcp1
MGFDHVSGTHTQELDILLIENDPSMALLTKEAFREAGLSDRLIAVPDGNDAMAYLKREAKYKDHPYPDLIFLDLHLPKKSGFEVLTEIKHNPHFSATPVVVISGSSDPSEIRKAYELHASCYIRKPDNLDDFLKFVQICFAFWGPIAILPQKPDLTAVSS